MLLIFAKVILSIVMIAGARAQDNQKFGYFDTSIQTDPNLKNTDLIPNKYALALEKSINPNNYIIGPGDVLGININTIEKMFFSSVVGPVGDLLIPGVGSVQISGLNLDSSITFIEKRILKTFKNADIDVSLIGLKSFKVPLFGAVNEPGFAVVQAHTRLDGAIKLVGGLHRNADENNVQIINKNGDSTIVNIEKYLLNGDLEQNPILNEGDRIKVFFSSDYEISPIIGLTLKKTPILVSGFVNNPGAIKYFPGYNVSDYIGFAGGASEIGSKSKIYLIRNGKKFKANFLDIALPGDQIFIPEGSFSVVFGKNSFLQNITALFSIISTYTIISDRINNN